MTRRRKVTLWGAVALVSLAAVLAGVGRPARVQGAVPPLFRMLNNDRLRFGGNNDDAGCSSGCATVTAPEDSVSSIGLLKQPFYFSTIDNKWYKLTSSDFPLDLAIGTGTANDSNWSGNTVKDITPAVMSEMTFDTSGYTEVAPAGDGVRGYGTITSSGTAMINGQKFLISEAYDLAPTSSFIQVTTTITNTSASDASNVNVWVGTQDDYVGQTDRPTETKGNLVDGGFVPTTANNLPGSALMVTSGSKGVLLSSATAGSNASIGECCSFRNAYGVKPIESPRTFNQDGSYALYMPVGDLEIGASQAVVWKYDVGATPPSNVTAVAANLGATVSWNAPDLFDRITGYSIRYRSGSGAWTVLPAVAATPLTATVTGLTDGVTYEFQVAAVTGTTPAVVGTYSPSTIVRPGTPVNISLPTIDGTPLAFSTLSVVDPNANWDSTDLTAMTPTYQWRRDGVDIPDATSPTWLVTPWPQYTWVSVEVTRTNASGSASVESDPVIVPPASPPDPPTDITGAIGDGQVTVSWAAPADIGGFEITGYNVIATPGGLGCSTAGTSCTVVGLTNGAEYTFTVTATNRIGRGAASTSDAVVPGTPVNSSLPTIAGTPSAGSTLTVVDPDANWTSMDGSPMTASYQWRVNGVDVAGATSPTWLVTWSRRDTSVSVVVTRTNQSGAASVLSVAVTVPAARTPDAPTNISGVIGDGLVTVAWTAPTYDGGTPITGYTVTAWPAGIGCHVAVTATTCTVAGLTNGTPYTFSVTASNGVGTGPPSIVSSVYVPAPLPSGATEYVPVGPARLVDTRPSSLVGMSSPVGECTTRVPVAGRGGVPLNATAAVLTITVDHPTTAGWVAVFPAGAPFTGVSNVNFAAGEIRANSSIVELGIDGAVDVRFYEGACTSPVIVDVTGAFVPTTATAGIGRFVSTGINRVLDTRNAATPTAGAVTTLSPALLGVPADAISVAVNITVTDTTGPGFVAAYPAGTTRGAASTLNADAAGDVRAGFSIQPISSGGLSIYQYMGANVIVEVVGYMTGTTTQGGAYVPAPPVRVVDTRPDHLQGFASTSWAGIVGARAVVANWTITESSSAGWIAVRPSDATGTAHTSTVNAEAAGENVANLAITPMGPTGITAQVGYTNAAVIADYAGYFTA